MSFPSPQWRSEAPPAPPPVAVVAAAPPVHRTYWTGDKFPGGFGDTFDFATDYWTIRKRSAQLFKSNIYAKGIIRRLVTNEIHTGLHLEAKPEERVLGLERDELVEWTEDVETRYALWRARPEISDFYRRSTHGEVQRTARTEALIEGDVLVVLLQDPATRLPRVRLVPGRSVVSPIGGRKPRNGHKIVHGVELDALGRQVAYWVRREDGTSKRLPAWGERSGRRIAWLVYGTPLRLGEVRGESLLSVVLQSLREIDRYRDATLRKAVINSMLAMFIEKEAPVTSSRPITRSGAVRRDQVSAGDPNAPERTFGMTGLVPGLVIEELQEGETPKPFPTSGTDMGFGEFERAVIYAVAWANEIPPEILTLSFGSNYSASQAAINEFKTYLNKVRTAWGSSFCRPIYEEWLIAEVMNRRINASGLLDAWMDPALYDIYGAWVNSEWAGNIKPAVDLSKLVAGYEALVANGWMTRDRASRELTGTKYSKNAQQLRVENEQLAEANKALPQKSASAPPPTAEEIDEADEAENDDDNRDDEGKKAA